ncbi:RICIN domain-containing protein [Streptomyces buecherae]|uniref:XRE family transcriptional regulator n=1 Tax=Streptomyces buecherae TaxID=2763006 RepID=A0A7H8NHQ1_9ACTN|nr:helix-turn-helix domain-containing protein [Streptomyces buecherae]QKW54053.1 XRE family transcriptional regulator [Streptomyces buecherae]
MANVGEIQPQQAANVHEFTTAMRQLKGRSGLTYRQIEERAAEHGEVLARSTLADVLGGKVAPRPELVAAFARVCGDEERVSEWLEARDRAVSGGGSQADSADSDDSDAEAGAPTQRTRRGMRQRRVPALLLGITVVSLGAATVWGTGIVGAPGGSGGGGGDASAPSGKREAPPRGPVEIRPALADNLCLTDGHAEGYDSLVAVQRPCQDVAPQETELVPAAGGTFRVQWYHPDHGRGCLNVVTARTGAALLEPWEDCAKTSRFHLEPAASGGGGQYVLRVAGGGCVAIGGSAKSAGAPAVQQPCDGNAAQVFSLSPAT